MAGENFVASRTARFISESTELVKKVKGKLSLTQKAIQLLQAKNRIKFFRELMISYTSRYNWSLNDYYPDKPVGQLGWGFLVYMLAKYGDEVKSIQFYVEKDSVAFPYFINFFDTGYSTPVESFFNCYKLCTFEQFFMDRPNLP